MNQLKINKFLSKLFYILEVHQYFTKTFEYGEAIGWCQDGQTIEIRDTKLLEERILPSFFILTKLNSFIRQLHLYNFKKVNGKLGMVRFRNDLFRKNQKKLSQGIIRKRKTKSQRLMQENILKTKQRINNKVNISNQINIQPKEIQQESLYAVLGHSTKRQEPEFQQFYEYKEESIHNLFFFD